MLIFKICYEFLSATAVINSRDVMYSGYTYITGTCTKGLEKFKALIYY